MENKEDKFIKRDDKLLRQHILDDIAYAKMSINYYKKVLESSKKSLELSNKIMKIRK